MVGEDTELTSKERILEAAICLFARNGYAATGIRKIVSEAGASIAMINYHFGSKQALLEEIIDLFFQRILIIAQKSLAGDDLPDKKLRRYFRSVIEAFRGKPELLRIAITEMPNEIPGLVQFKADRVKRIVGIFAEKVIPNLPDTVRRNIRIEVAGPAMVGMLIFHFIINRVSEDLFGKSFDDSFYDGLAEELSDLFLYGLFGRKAAEKHTQGDT